MKQRLATLAIISLFGVLGTASASVVGTLNLQNCSGDGVTVSQTEVDWLPAGVGSTGTGCIQASTGTNVTFNGGNIADLEFGVIKDLTGNLAQNTGFMTFSGAPGVGTLAFDLITLGPGSSTPCSAGMALFAVCSVGGAGPIVLEKTGANSTSVFLSASGTVSDGSSPNSNWVGLYTTQFANLAPIDIQNFILGIADSNTGKGCTEVVGTGGSCTSTFSGSFDVEISSVPEPGSMFLIGAGLLGLATTLRKRKK